MTSGIMTAVTALAAGTLSVILAILVMRLVGGPDHDRPCAVQSDLDSALQPIVLLFRNGVLIDATPPARMLLDGISGSDDPWSRLMNWLATRLPDDIARITPDLDEPLELVGSEGHGSARLRLLAEPLAQGALRLRLTDPAAQNTAIMVDSLAQDALEAELELLRGSLDHTPMLVWRQDAAGRVIWANGAYVKSAEMRGGGQAEWPLPRLMEVSDQPGQRRAQLELGGAVHWYDCHTQRAGDQTMFYAVPADAAVRAERSLREFVQTLTKTFADLPIGLAIFDRERKLQLFNPALIDLTGLPTGFLTARPTLFDLLDRLREMRMVPEPRDYRSWRQQMASLEAAAATGHHVETWSLPGGQTYRVTGRPHPDGAVAFLFEDITSEISLTRKFRAELSLGAMVMDQLDDALAVFAPGGKLELSNGAYDSLWGEVSVSLPEALRLWETRITAGSGFQRLREHLLSRSKTGESGAMAAPEGGLMGWSVANLAGGRKLVRFQRSPALTGPQSGNTASAPPSRAVPSDTAPAVVDTVALK